MAMRRVVAELPGSVEELCLVRLGLVARKLSAIRFVRWYGRNIDRSAREAIVAGTGLLRSERFAFGWGHLGFLQYWSGFEALDDWSHRAPHAEWWRAAAERMRTKGDVGVYHESFLVPRANVESIYLDCPPVGLASFGLTADPVGPKTTARDRLRRRTPP
jgi:hypothetical protein